MKALIDEVSADRKSVSGWIEVGDPSVLPRIVAIYDGTEIALAELGPGRNDVFVATGLENRAFTIAVDRPIGDLDILGGRFRVCLLKDGSFVEVSFSNGGRRREAERTIRILGGVLPDSAALVRTPIDNLRPTSPDEMSPIGFPVGLTSSDRSALVGPGGHLFLVGATNNVADQYRPAETRREAARIDGLAASWASLIDARRSRLDNLGIDFIQVIIPEKLTMLGSAIGFDRPTALLSCLENRLSGVEYYVSALSLLAKWEGAAELWLKLDSHLAPAGSYVVVQGILGSISGASVELAVENFTTPVFYQGDLTRRIFGFDVWDYCFAPDAGSYFMASVDCELVRSEDPREGGHIGIQRVWRNPAAPIDLCVVVFGNSFFGADNTSPTRLNWWFTRIFTQVHFLWSPLVDDDYAVSVGADLVVAQGVERYLGSLPLQ